MKTNYSSLSPEDLREEHKRLHGKLVLPNIAIVLLSLFAAFSLLFMPLLGISVHLDEGTGQLISDAMSEGSEGSEGSGADAEEISAQYAFLLKDVDIDVGVTLQPTELFGAAFSEGREGLRSFIDSAAGDLVSVVNELSEQVMPAMLGATVMGASGVEIGGVDPSSVSTEEFASVIEKLNAQDLAGARSDFEAALPAFLAQLNVAPTEEQLQSAMESYDSMIGAMTEDGTKPFDTANLIDAFTGGGEEGAEETEGGMGDLLSMLSDPGSVVDEMDEETVQTIRTVCMGISVGILVFAGLWALLALLALLHIFLPNKKVGMWYVKLTGAIPCLLFFLLPMIALSVLPQAGILPEQVATILPAVSVSSLTIVSGVCWVLLWLVSIFWCHPVKKRIKRCKDALRA